VVLIDWIDPNPFLEVMKRSSLLALMSTGYSWIDTKKARRLGISVSNVPGYATEAVAEHIIGLMFAVARKTIVGDSNIRKGKKEKGYLEGVELAGKKAGIVGLGRIGRRVAEIATDLGLEVTVYDPDQKHISDIKYLTLDNLLRLNDVVFVTCPLNETSRNMLNADKLRLMKQNSILLSTTWGVVDLDAITDVLRDKLIYGAGFDISIEGSDIVLPKEFTDLENMVLTPGIGFNTGEAKIRQVDICISNIENSLKGSPENIVN
jgi:D-3-phosphoglycerate dehydrogenase